MSTDHHVRVLVLILHRNMWLSNLIMFLFPVNNGSLFMAFQIQQRCFCGNMVKIPVEVETPDHHYHVPPSLPSHSNSTLWDVSFQPSDPSVQPC